MVKNLQHAPVKLSVLTTEMKRDLPSARIETAGSPEEIRDAVRKWAGWGIISYPLFMAYRQSRETQVNNEEELMGWAEHELRSRA